MNNTSARRAGITIICAGLLYATQALAQAPGTEDGQWHYLGGDSAHTRYSPADQITPDNFEDVEESWAWDGASFGAASGRSTPSYIDGVLYTVAGPRRHVVAIDSRG